MNKIRRLLSTLVLTGAVIVAGLPGTAQAQMGSLTASSSVTFGTTTVATSGNEVVLVSGTPHTKGVLIKAHVDNAGTIYVGLTGVTGALSIPLEAGESVLLGVNLAKVTLYLDASANAQKVNYCLYGS